MSRLTAYAAVFFALTATQLGAASTAHAVPNDTIAQAAPLEPRKPVQATNVGALTEPADVGLVCPEESPFGLRGEDILDGVEGPFAPQASVWWRFRRGPRTTVVSTTGSSIYTTLVVWRRTPGGPLELVECDNDRGNSGPGLGASVYLQRQGGRGARVPPDPPGTEYFAQVGGCVGGIVPGGLDCGAVTGNIRVGVYEGLDDTRLDFWFIIGCRWVRVNRLRLTSLPNGTRITAEWQISRRRNAHHERAIRLRRRSTFDALRLTGPLRLLIGDPDYIRLFVRAPGRVGKWYQIDPVPGGRAPRARSQCLFARGFTGDCGYPKVRYREPRNLRCARRSDGHLGATVREPDRR